MTKREIADAIGVKVNSIGPILSEVRKTLGHALCFAFGGYGRGKTSFYSYQVDVPTPARFTLPEDLYRGWVNPTTGYVPARLGLGA